MHACSVGFITCFASFQPQIETDNTSDFPPKKKPTRLAIGELHVLWN